MSSPPPTKPPRGVKQGKETSGLLMSVIRTLSASETNEQREKERAKLEKEYKKSDARLDELVAVHAQEIMDVMQKFSQVGAALGTWGQHCDAARARLSACRGLLRLRRDDLRRLWADARTHHYALNMLTDISQVVEWTREAGALVSRGLLVSAAHSLRAASAAADTSLAHVSALHATREHLQVKKHELVEMIVRRLSDAVYRSERAPLSRRVCDYRRTTLLLAELSKNGEVSEEYLQDITPELEASLTEEDMTFETTVMICLEALAVLDQLREATEKFKCQIQNELLEVIESVSKRIIEEGDIEVDTEAEEGDGEGVEGEGGRALAALVTCLGEEFRAAAGRNKRLLQLWRAALQKNRYADTCLHTEHQYWSAVQQVLQLLLTDYLEIESVTQAASRAAVSDAPRLRLADYFAKKKVPRREKLFRLAPAPGRSPGPSPGRRALWVCPPDAAHLYAALPALHALAADIESEGGGECSLRAFVSDYVRTGEAERLAAAARASIDAAARDPHAWRARTPVPAKRPGSRPVIVFEVCVSGWEAVRRAAEAARRAGGLGGAHATRAAHAAIAALATHARAAHTRLTPAGAPRAVRWLADDDIVRFLTSLANWRLRDNKQRPNAQELNQAYDREAEILGSSLGDGALNKSEIIADVNALTDIAVLCESMEWLSANIKTVPSIIAAPNPRGGAVRAPDSLAADIAAAAAIFHEIAHKCLLLLHLELRIECFYYICRSDEAEAEGEAPRLARALLAFHDHAGPVLHANRLAYVLNGIGEMMSAAVVSRWQSSAGAGPRLDTLRHALAALHLPHSGLQRAQLYLHLLACTPEEIIASVREKGAQFSELEYLNAFKVIGARRGLSEADMRAHLQKLSAALGHVGVTV